MLFWTIVKVGVRSLLAKKLRSFLAMLGIIIGVAAVISMLALGAGARRQILDSISAMGTNLLLIRPGQSGSRGVVTGTTQNLTVADAQALMAEAPGIARIAPIVSGSAQVKCLNRNTRTSIYGAADTYLAIRNFKIEFGRIFNEVEVDHAARVAVLGPDTAENLFDGQDPLGQVIKIKGINFKVIGVLLPKGEADDQVIIPYTTAMKQVFGVNYLREIVVQASGQAALDDVQAAVTAVLRKRHRIEEGAPADFTVRNQAEIIRTASAVSRTITLLLGGIGSIALVVGGIGIMNIMLVTVTERTREIGVRMAIGATRRNIHMQFLIESLIISGLGGLIGVLVGIAGARGICYFTQRSDVEEISRFYAVVELRSVLMALSFSGMVGVFFGWYPARCAANLKPIEALRYE